jgi:outer membrane receptor protein involved in Fe transport
VDYNWKPLPWVNLKLGTYQQWKVRQVFRRVYLVNEGDLKNAPSDMNTPTGGYGNYIDYNLVQFREQDLGKVWSTTYLRDDGSALKVYDRTSGSDAYTGTEQNNAGYMGFSLLPFQGKLDVYGGLRAEYDRIKVAGAIAPSAVDFTTGELDQPVLSDHSTLSWLPSLNIGYRPNTQWVLRGAYGKTVNRPEFREISPYADIDYINQWQVYGNPGIVSAGIDNYDARLEWYPGKNNTGESISVGVFYKSLQHPIERVLISERTGPSLTSITYENADKATIRGLELEMRKNLDFIPLPFF